MKPTELPEGIERFEFEQDADEAAQVSEFGPWVRFSDLPAIREQAVAEEREKLRAALLDRAERRLQMPCPPADRPYHDGWGNAELRLAEELLAALDATKGADREETTNG